MEKVFKNFPMVSRVVYGNGCIASLDKILNDKRQGNPMVFLVDDVFQDQASFFDKLPIQEQDYTIIISALYEPKTDQVDAIVAQIKNEVGTPAGIIGVGGGTLLDLAKATAILMTNPGQSKDYQGWDLVPNPALYHVGIPTISGTGAEVSRTTILTGPTRKLGINSDYTPFDQVVLDPELTQGVSKEQWFYTGMDCYVHCVESLSGTMLNAFSRSYGEKAMAMCLDVFLHDTYNAKEAREALMMASWHGGMSIAYSQVGICHALSYGLGYVLGIKHGIGNCIVLDHLEEYYPEGVAIFKKMKEKHGVSLPQKITASLSQSDMNLMVDTAWNLTPLWENALGSDWQSKISKEDIEALYHKM